jgi:hypothetical protein
MLWLLSKFSGKLAGRLSEHQLYEALVELDERLEEAEEAGFNYRDNAVKARRALRAAGFR